MKKYILSLCLIITISLFAQDKTNSPFNLSNLNVYNVKDYGLTGNGTTEDSTALKNLLTIVSNAGGGIIYFPNGTYKISCQIKIPHNTANPPAQVPITLMGVGGKWDGTWVSTAIGCSILDLRFAGTGGKLLSVGRGTITLQGINWTDLGTSSNPFIYITNTTPFIQYNSFWGNATKSDSLCNQDAIVCGGTTTSVDSTLTGAFQGYGGSINNNYFARIRRGIYGRVYFNSMSVINNTWSTLCGSDTSAAAIELDGTGGFNGWNNIGRNTIEVTGYRYGVKFKNSTFNNCYGTQIWDAQSHFKYSIRLLGNASGNSFNGALVSGKEVEKNGNSIYTQSGTNVGTVYFVGGANGVIIRPTLPTAYSDDLFAVTRSLTDSQRPNAQIFHVTQGGMAYLEGTESSPAGGYKITNGANSLTMDHTSIVLNNGSLGLYAGSNHAYNTVSISRGLFQINSSATHPTNATYVGAGTGYYNTHFNMPYWDNGVAWKNAIGADSVKIVGDSLIINIGAYHYAIYKKPGNSGLEGYWYLSFGILPLVNVLRKKLEAKK